MSPNYAEVETRNESVIFIPVCLRVLMVVSCSETRQGFTPILLAKPPWKSTKIPMSTGYVHELTAVSLEGQDLHHSSSG